jgi:serine/threonine protein phosphatase 1
MLLRKKISRKDRWPCGPPGKRLYAIGDVHGCLSELVCLLERIERDHVGRPAKECHIVFLGDLIDRGPDSCGVVRLARQGLPAFAKAHFIRGNHEEMLVRGLSGEPGLIPAWLAHGGRSCAVSYGIDPSRLHDSDPGRLEHLLLSHIPADDIAFLAGCVDSVRFGDYLLVHAGIRPGVPLAEQKGHDLRWIRADFLESQVPHEAMIVHGHTISDGIVTRPNRIGIDTGAYQSGCLSALRIEEDETSILDTHPYTPFG